MSDDDIEQAGAPAGRGWRGLERRTRRLIVAGGAFAVVLVIAAVAVLTVPVPVSIVAPRILQAVGDRLGPGYNVSIGRARIDHSGAGIGFRLDDFAIRDPAGNTVLSVPQAVIGLSGDFLIGRKINATSVRLTAPHLTLRIGQGGEVSLAAAKGAPPLFRLPAGEVPKNAPARLVGLLAAADATLGAGGLFADLKGVEINDADIEIDDQRRDRVDHFNAIDLRLMRQRGGHGLLVSAMSAAPGDHWSVRATLNGAPGAARDLDVGFRGFSLDRSVFEAMHGNSPVTVSGMASGHLHLRLGPKGDIPRAEAQFDIGGLKLAMAGKPDTGVAFDRARAELQWDGAHRRLTMNDAELVSGAAHASFSGTATAGSDKAELWDFKLAGRQIVLPADGPETVAVLLDHVRIEGHLDRTHHRLTIAQAVLASPLVTAAGRATFDFGGKVPSADLSLAMGRAQLATLLRLWPKAVAPNGRAWVAERVHGATIDSLSLAVAGPLEKRPGGPKLSVALQSHFSDTAVELLKGMPPLTAAAGTVAVRGLRLTADIAAGKLSPDASHTIELTGSRFTLHDVLATPTEGVLALHGTGSLSAFGALLRTPKLAHVLPPAIDLRRGTGQVRAQVEVSGPMGRHVKLAHLATKVNASLTAGGLDGTVAGYRVSDATLGLIVDGGTAVLKGRLNVGGAPVALDARAIREPHGRLGKTVVAASFDPAKLHKGGEGSAVAGPTAVRLTVPRFGDLDGAKVEADLTGAAVTLPAGLAKPVGRPAMLVFDLATDGDGWLLKNFAFDAGPMAFHGAVRLTGKGALASARLPTFKVSKGDDLGAVIDHAGNTYKVVLRGGSLNLRPFLHEAIANAGTMVGGPDVDITAKLGTVVGYGGEAIAGLDLTLSRANGALGAFDLQGRLGSGRIVSRSERARRRITLSADDGGAALRFLGIYRRVRGGALRLALLPGKVVTQGDLVMRDFGTVGESTLDPVLPQGGKGGSGTVRFTRMHAAFRLAGGRVLLDNAAIWGPEVGASLSGDIDYAQGRINVRGTFVPAYLVNNLFSKLPIIGAILGGGPNEGLLGITFKIAGPLNHPALQINPLSAVAPGFLRKLFEFREADLSPQAGATPPPPHRSSTSDPTAPMPLARPPAAAMPSPR